MNEAGKIGIGCDILIKMNNEINEYVEVKSSRFDKKEFYRMSGSQWALAHRLYNEGRGNSYFIFVARKVFDKSPIICPIQNPIKKWKDGKLFASPVNFEF